MTPIFIFSAPRTGSTLLQRILASHEDIATIPEPWILLPLISMTKDNALLSNYSSDVCAKAINSFTAKVDENNSYNELLADFVLSLYQSACKENESFFIDKTPRYYYIIDEIIKLFPNAKFIFLFRNPMQVYSSVLTTWCNNRFFKLYRNRDDLYLAPKILTNAYQKYKDISISINYDDLVNDNDSICRAIYDYLGVKDNSPISFDCQKNTFDSGDMGDSTGQTKYQSISNHSINNWQMIFDNPVRKWYLKRYIEFLGDEVADAHGYDKNRVKKQIESLPSSPKVAVIKDIIGILYQRLVFRFKLNVLISSKHIKKQGFFD